MNIIKVIDFPWFGSTKILGMEINTSSDGEWQVTSKTGMRHVDIFSIKKCYLDNEPTLLTLTILGLHVSFALDDLNNRENEK